MKALYIRVVLIVSKLLKLKWLAITLLLFAVMVIVPIILGIVLCAIPFILVYVIYDTYKKYKFRKWYLTRIEKD